MTKARIIVAVILCMIGLHCCGQTNYYASPTGSNGNTGLSTNSPWTIAKAVTNMGPDITVILMPGSYSAAGGVAISEFNNATPGLNGHPTTLKSLVKWGAVLSDSVGTPNLYIGTGFSNVVVDGLVISNSVDNYGLANSGNNNTIRNCWIVHNWLTGYIGTTLPCSNNVVEYCLVEHNSMMSIGDTTKNQYHGLYFGGPNNIVRGNVVRYNGNGYGIQFFCGYAGETLTDNQIYNNVTYGNTNQGGIVVASALNTNSFAGTNYVFCNTALDGITFAFGTACASNNIAIASPVRPTAPIYMSIAYPVVAKCDYNLSNQALSPAGPHDVVTGYFGFDNPPAGLYWLLVNSPARGVALSAICASVDFFGNAQSSVSDIGAYQYSANLVGDSRILDPSPAYGADYWAVIQGIIFPGTVNTINVGTLRNIP